MSQSTAAVSFPCKSCGGSQVFDPDRQALQCPYCGGQEEIVSTQAVPVHALEDVDEHAHHDWGAETRNLHCNNCGASIVRDTRIQSDSCPFCDSALVEENTQPEGLLPEGVIPFRVSHKKAVEAFNQWVKKRYMAPLDFVRSVRSDKLSGLYLPYWLFDCRTSSDYTAERGDHYYVTEQRTVMRDGKRVVEMVQVQHTRWTPVSGRLDRAFEHMTQQASGHEIVDKASGFDLSDMRAYQKAYLSGFGAERYTVPLHAGWERMQGELKRILSGYIAQQIGGDEVRNLQFRTRYDDVRYRHTLFPCWVSAYTYRGKLFSFVVNGQTGRVRGDAPVSPWKVALIVLGVAAVLLLVYYFVNS